MKVIFLDIDGVLNSYQDYFSREIKSSRHIELLRKLVDETDAQIVLSSSWRIIDGLKKTVHERLRDHGMDFVDETPQIYSAHRHRGDEIRAWLKDHPDVTNFVILDDESDMCEFTGINLVKTNPEVGLQESDILRAIHILNRR